MAMAIGFFGLKMLMQQRPQFTGQPMRFSKTELVQESPQVVIRKGSDDISIIKPAQPEEAEVQFRMRGRRDYRGLRTIIDMSGEVRARYVLTNTFEEPIFLLFRCPHPRTAVGTAQGPLVGALKLECLAPGLAENTKEAWLWSGSVEARGSVVIALSYQVAAIKGISYRMNEASGNPVKQLRVTLVREDLAAMAFETGQGTLPTAGDTVVWERKDFLAPDFFSASIMEGRNLFSALSQLLEIGPLVSLLFLVSVLAVVLARQSVTVIQVLTISAAFAVYFPLILYLSSRFAFTLALVIAVVVPGVLILNYGRWLLGFRTGFVGGMIWLALFQVFPTLAVFAGWNRGMVLLSLGIVTLWLLINLQNRVLRRRSLLAGLIGLLAGPGAVWAGEVQVIVPAELARTLLGPKPGEKAPLIAFEHAQYRIGQEAAYFRVGLLVPFQVLRAGNEPITLFDTPVHLQESHLEMGGGAAPAQLAILDHRPALHVANPGQGVLRLAYRVPVQPHEGKKRAQVPLFTGSAGTILLESVRGDLEFANGSLWEKSGAGKTNRYEIGVTGGTSLAIEWRDRDEDGPSGEGPWIEGGRALYGIGITKAQHLTVMHSDGSCAHFVEVELPVQPTEEFKMRLPAQARLVSASVDGIEVASPTVEGQVCRIPLPARVPSQMAHRLSCRMTFPPVRLGFVGSLDLALPQVDHTVGRLEWVVALPGGFDVQVVASGMELQASAPDLSRFGDYGRILQAHPQTALVKDLAPPGSVQVNLKYRQRIPGLQEFRRE
jgi:hypothetical protein